MDNILQTVGKVVCKHSSIRGLVTATEPYAYRLKVVFSKDLI